MKILKILFLFISVNTLFAQNVTITPWGITPQQNSAVPRLTYDAIMQMIPSEGDMAYDLTFHCLRIYNGQKWTCTTPNSNDITPNVSIITTATATVGGVPVIAADNNGHVYFGGNFNSGITLSNKNNYPNQTLLSAGLSDFYIAKYDNQGWLLWVKQFGSSYTDGISKVKVDYVGNIIITGYFGGTVNFGGISKTAIGDTDAFIAKYSSSGNLVWVKTISGVDLKSINGLTTDNNGNIYITGDFLNTVNFDSITKTSLGGYDVFFAKYDENSNIQWVKTITGTNSESSKDIEIDNSGNLYLIGNFAGTTLFDNVSRTTVGLNDIFLTKYDSNGNILWVKTFGSIRNESGQLVSIDSWGNVYISGYFSGSLSFDGVSKTSSGQDDIFFAKYNSNGNLIRVISFGGTENDYANDLVQDTGNNIYLTGSFQATSIFGNISKTASGLNDIFILKLDELGNLNWVQTYGGVSNDSGHYLTIDNLGNLFNSGRFAGVVSIGGIKYEIYPNPTYLLRLEK